MVISYMFFGNCFRLKIEIYWSSNWLKEEINLQVITLEIGALGERFWETFCWFFNAFWSKNSSSVHLHLPQNLCNRPRKTLHVIHLILNFLVLFLYCFSIKIYEWKTNNFPVCLLLCIANEVFADNYFIFCVFRVLHTNF